LFLTAASTHCVAASITHLVSVEVIEGLFSTVRMWTNVAVLWIEAVINVAVEVAGTMAVSYTHLTLPTICSV